jgi:dipeptidase E
MRRLFLASEAKNPKSYKKLQDYVGGLRDRKIAYIPTAANGEEPYGSWEKGATYNLVKKSGAVVEPVLLEDYKNKSVLKKLKGKDIIWFAGGMCGYLMYWVRRCEIDKKINELLKSGIIYVGSSAGGMVTAKTLDIAEAFLDEIEQGAKVIPGFGLVDFDIYPHYEDNMFADIKRVWRGGDLYLLKNGEALIIEGNKVEIFGQKRILRAGNIIK